MFGRLVLVALVVFGLWYVISHYPDGTAFGCQPAGRAVAHADSGDCPANIIDADGDAQWAADRWATIKAAKVTTGLFYDQDGHEHSFLSGEDTDTDLANHILRDTDVAFPRRADTHPAAAHVEAKAAARMRAADVPAGVMVINNPKGVCGGEVPSPYGCVNVLPVLLPHGATLVVWWHDPTDNKMTNAQFVGR
jgi:hypothetical protein